MASGGWPVLKSVPNPTVSMPKRSAVHSTISQKSWSVAAAAPRMIFGYMLSPMTPPLSTTARMSSSVLLRRLSSMSKPTQLAGLAWVMAMGRSEYSTASREVCSPQWETSTSIPTWFISRITLRP